MPRAVFMGFAEISGFYSGLAQGFTELGLRCTLVDLGSHRFAYARPRQPALVRAVESVSVRRAHGGATAAAWLPVGFALRLALFAWAVLRHDMFVFGSGTSFFRLRELALLKALGKTVIFQFHGSDGRPPYIDGAVVQGDSPEEIELVTERAAAMKARFRRIDRHGDHVINNPTHGHFHTRPMVVWLRVGLPNRPSQQEPTPAREAERVRVLHCPSDLRAKGTHEIRSMVERLKQRGQPIEYVEVIGRPHSVVLEELERCDLVIDQLYADYGMPGFATEAAWYGKPVVIGGFAAGFWKRVLPEDERPPTEYCLPDEVEGAVERLVSDPAAREALGERARQFVERAWSPRLVAERYLALASGDCPDDWLYNPNELDYLHGCGLREDDARAVVRAVVDAGGAGALQLADKPELEQAFISWCR